MAFTRYLTLGLLTVAGAPMAFAQKAPEHADELFIEVQISSGGNLYTACRDNGFADKDLADCWGMALAANYAAIDDPHRIQPGTFYLTKTSDMLASELASARSAPGASTQSLAASQSTGVSDEDYRLALSDASRWQSQFNAVQGENQKLLTENETLKLERDNFASELGLARGINDYWLRIMETVRDQADDKPLDQAALEEILRAQGPPPVNLDDTTGVTFEAKDGEILFYKWVSLGLGVSVLALAVALAWMARTRKGSSNPAPAQKPVKDRKTLRGHLSSLGAPFKRDMKPAPSPAKGDATGYWLLGAPQGTKEDRKPFWSWRPHVPQSWMRKGHEAKVPPLAAAPEPAPALPVETPAPAGAPEPEPPPAVQAEPAQVKGVSELGPPDSRGYYYAEHEFTLAQKYLLPGHSPLRRTAVRFDGGDIWQARLPRGGWANLIDDYATRLVAQSDCFDRKRLDGERFEEAPAIIFENLPTKESFTLKIPAKVAEEAAP